MIKNIILAGVGGQGILTIAAIIDHAAMEQNLYIKQAEVHGMSQRGGAVQSHLRISNEPIYSDLIPLKQAHLILSLEPMESLRYLPYLAKDATIISSTEPVKNIPNYPDEAAILDVIKNSGYQSVLIDASEIAREAGSLKTMNVALIGAASKLLTMDRLQLESSIKHFFSAKGDDVVDMNLKAFSLGYQKNIT